MIDAAGREIGWNQVSRINQDEMKALITGIVDKIYTFLTRTIFSETEEKAFLQAVERAGLPWIKNWDEPKYLADFLMPVPPRSEKEG